MDAEPDIDPTLMPQTGMRCMKFPNQLATPSLLETLDWNLEWSATPKLDGNRCLIVDGRPMTSSGRPFRNENVNRLLMPLIEVSSDRRMMFDLEIYDTEADHRAALSGALNSFTDELPPTTSAFVFDAAPTSRYLEQCMDYPYHDRVFDMLELHHHIDHGSNIRFASPVVVRSPNEVLAFYEEALTDGYEGAIIRAGSISPCGLRGGWYKHGRATRLQSIGFKMKPYETIDGIIVGVVPRREMVADVERRRNPDGTLARVNNKSAYADTECAGAMLIAHGDGLLSEVSFAVGFDMESRRRLWVERQSLIGKHAEFLHMSYGAKEDTGKLRHGRLVRLRPDLDA